ncbi:MAG: aldo/keto reductase [Halioglobus sp.]|jgi:aryl-alcohol dehydrogenase-like predicted oxidoreductase|nr:aldo/keto reductase [Halieaceae bacterium]MDG1390021.1 aldo/keto reductase [Halioglobus sp.]MBT5007759.1 aldo/keto reductase [Halieaceae bacterium]MBT6123665.1 aldo/keto reductase [Halieaceae bacterium]MBT7719703.1 aldo/keto reductase [Halieaceae bacterium]
MQKNRLGKSSIVVSDICMGTMTFGNQADEKTSFRIMDMAYDAGVDFYDTAEMYPVPPDAKYAGLTEEIVGRWMKTKNRDALIIATKVAGPSHGWIEAPLRSGMTGLDRHHITRAVEGSLRRLDTDYIDLYQTHWPDWDYPQEEIMLALDELVRAGKVRILGCSNESTWGLTKSLWASDIQGVSRYETIQNNFSLNNRRFEDELAQACRKENVSLIPYSPLGGGVLSGKYNGGAFPEGARFTLYQNKPERQQAMMRRFVNEQTLASTERFQAIAADLDISVSTLAIAWSKQHDFVASTIIGATTTEQVPELLAAADVTLTNETMARINSVSQEIRYPMG